MKDWKEDLFNKNDYNWTDEEFESWAVENRGNINNIEGGLQTHKRSVKSISNIMFAHRIDNLNIKQLGIVEHQRVANILWKDHLKRIGCSYLKSKMENN